MKLETSKFVIIIVTPPHIQKILKGQNMDEVLPQFTFIRYKSSTFVITLEKIISQLIYWHLKLTVNVVYELLNN